MDALAENLRRLRKLAKLTQAELADLSGLPRATLAHLEQPGGNPSVVTVMAVAKALDVSVDELLTATPEQRHYLVTPEQQQEHRAEHGKYVARLLSPITSKGVQIQAITLQPGCRSVGRPHPQGAQEFFFTHSGRARLRIADDIVDVPAGCLVQFPGHLRHVYENIGREIVTAVSTVVFRLG